VMHWESFYDLESDNAKRDALGIIL